MVKGGARLRSGPAPDPNALRRDRDSAEWLTLPASGRVGDPPIWPLRDPFDRELEMWAALWAKPQAILWERDGQEQMVALYVRRLVEAEVHNAAVNLSTLVKQLGDHLLLTIPAMLSAKVKIGTVVVEAEEVPVARKSSRSRLKVVSSGDAGA